MGRPSPSMIVALLALFVALGGTAIAAKNALKVRSKDIVNGQVKAADLANNSVTSAKVRNGQVGAADLAPNSVDSSKVQDNSLTGSDINESTLALGALDAATFDGGERCARSVRLQPDAISPLKVNADLCEIGPFTIEAECEAEGNPGESLSVIVKVATTENDSFFSSSPLEGKPLAELNAGAATEFYRHNEFEENGKASASELISFLGAAPSGATISGQMMLRGDSLAGTARNCDYAIEAVG